MTSWNSSPAVLLTRTSSSPHSLSSSSSTSRKMTRSSSTWCSRSACSLHGNSSARTTHDGSHHDCVYSGAGIAHDSRGRLSRGGGQLLGGWWGRGRCDADNPPEGEGEEERGKLAMSRHRNPASSQQEGWSSSLTSPARRDREGCKRRSLSSGSVPFQSASSFPHGSSSSSSPSSQVPSSPHPLKSLFLAKIQKLNSQKSPKGLFERNPSQSQQGERGREDEEDEEERKTSRLRGFQSEQGGEGKGKTSALFSQLRTQLSLRSSARHPDAKNGGGRRRGGAEQEEEKRGVEEEGRRMAERLGKGEEGSRRERGGVTRRSQSVPPEDTTTRRTGVGKKKPPLHTGWPFSAKAGEEEDKEGERCLRMSSSPDQGSERLTRGNERGGGEQASKQRSLLASLATGRKGRSFNNTGGEAEEGGKRDVFTWLKLRTLTRRE